MYDRKQLKSQAKSIIKKHYILLVALCLIAAILGSEFTSSISGWTSNTSDTSSEVSDIQSEQIIGGTSSFENVLSSLLSDDAKTANKIAQDKTKEYTSEKEDSSNRFGHTQGIIARIVRSISSGSILITVTNIFMNITKSTSLAMAIVLLIAFLLWLAFNIFIVSYNRVVMRRMFLEAGTYEKVPFSHMIHSYANRKNMRAALAYFKSTIYKYLWALTIIGYPIKSYAYAMVPYILAENPDLKGSEAITLSRKMMKGHKWQLFVLDCSLIGWYLLSAFTFGILDILFINPYITAIHCEYFKWLRTLSKENGLDDIVFLNDTYLYEKADTQTLQVAYADIAEEEKALQGKEIPLTGIQKFFAENFSIWIGTIASKNDYQAIQNTKYRISADHDALEKKTYPVRLNPLYKPSLKKSPFNIQFIRCYTIWSLILFFFLFSFIGWAWEVVLMLVTLGKFVNRGLLLGPWLPIYGTGGVVALLLLARLRKNPPACFCGAIILSGILEYSTAWYLEMAYHQKWWDYTGYFLNLDGRICAEGLLVFGVGCSLVIYLVGPLFDSFVSKRPAKVIIPLSIALLAIFGADVVYSHFHPNAGEGVTGSVEIENTTFITNTNSIPQRKTLS